MRTATTTLAFQPTLDDEPILVDEVLEYDPMHRGTNEVLIRNANGTVSRTATTYLRVVQAFPREVVGHRASITSAQRFINRYRDAIGDTTYWNGSRSIPVHIQWNIVPVAKGFDIVSTVTLREE